MRNNFNHKGHIGSIHFSLEDGVYYGKIEEINDLVTYEGETIHDLEKSFIEAIDDYKELQNLVS